MFNEQEQKLQQFIDEHVAKVNPLFEKFKLAGWNAYANGKDENWEISAKADQDYEMVYNDAKDYVKLVEFQKSGEINDSLLKRQLHILVNSYKGNQIPKDLLEIMISKEKEVEKIGNNYRGKVDEKEMTRNEMEDIFDNSNDNELRRKVWEAQKSIGPVIIEPLMELVKLRNKAATHLGYNNFYQMQIELDELNIDWLMGTFDRLYEQTEDSFVKAKEEVDAILKKRFGVNEIMPWHYSDFYFQSCPKVSDFDFNEFYGKKDIVPIAKRFYAGIGLNIEEFLKKSDLYKREGKNEHAFCEVLDKKGDVRILMNITNTLSNMNTLLHESGHAVYSLNIDKTLPWLLKTEAHTFTTEAVAMMFGGLAYSGKWMQEEYGFSNEKAERIEEIGFDLVKKQQLIFSRWCQVMVRFEKSMYENPDQDLNHKWWDLVEKYQHVKKPESRDMPDFASKDHIYSAPVYYHCYQLGELMAAQMRNYIIENITNSEMFKGNPKVGDYLKEKIFKPGARFEWNEMIEKATGEGLNPKHFANRYL